MPVQSSDISVGPYCGCVASDLSGSSPLPSPDIIKLVSGFPRPASHEPGRAFFFKTILGDGSGGIAVHVKGFARQNLIKDALDWKAGSKACRSWQIALAMRDRGVMTPRPVAFLDRWEGRRLLESYFLTELQQDACTFKDELIRLYTDDPECAKIMALLDGVAAAIKHMHDVGIAHRDLGNQNILVKPGGPYGCGEVQFVDLNRATARLDVGIDARAFDISRIALPSDLLRVFKEMYFGSIVPVEFQRMEGAYRKRFALHTLTRTLRHPLRSRRENRAQTVVCPADKDIWIWDERSAQAISPFTSHDRRRLLPFSSHLRVAKAALGSAPAIMRSYRAIVAQCFRNPVCLEGRIGVAISPTPENLERELYQLESLGKLPVMLRFYHHRGVIDWDFCAAVLRRLVAAGHSVSAALVQDRTAVKHPARWTAFVEHVMAKIADCVDMVEIGHAVNRSKWGIWTLDEHRILVEATASARAKYPMVRFIGPAGIDFEFPFVIAALKNLPAGFEFNAVSHHLYVDRRGAPEKRQGPFSALEKCALGRAIAENTPGCGGRFVVSEANWPLSGTGVYSPVGSPYVSPGPRFGDPSVDEDTYADYMIRYLLIACCSGTVERVYWWRLIARGFGLVDDTDPLKWRERSAFVALRFFVSLLGKSTFVEKIKSLPGVCVYLFNKPYGSNVAVAYTEGEKTMMRMPFAFSNALNSCGEKMATRGDHLALSGSPVYLLDVVR
ncbi:MAG: lipopolysaccharide kinase InaA family protein [bacterium]